MLKKLTQNKNLNELFDILDKKISIDPLSPLIATLDKHSPDISLSDYALSLDANALLRIHNHKKNTDIIDYLASHKAPIVISGQAIQEYWNNHLAAIDTEPKKVRKSFEAFKKTLAIREDVYKTHFDKIEAELGTFETDYGGFFSDRTKADIKSMFEALQGCATIDYVPRSKFINLAQERNDTKTPPGFKDPGHGDFYIWADTLFGLRQAQNDKKVFKRFALITTDVKKDWSTNGHAHPILVAEAKQYLGIEFETWTIDEFYSKLFDFIGVPDSSKE